MGQLMPSLRPLKNCCRDAKWGGSLMVRSKECSFFYSSNSLVGCNRIEKLDWLDLFSTSVVSESLLNGLSLFGSLKKRYRELRRSQKRGGLMNGHLMEEVLPFGYNFYLLTFTLSLVYFLGANST